MINFLNNNPFSSHLTTSVHHIVYDRLPGTLLVLVFGYLLIKLASWVVRLLLGLVRLPRGLRGILVSLLDALLWILLAIYTLQSLGLGNVALIFSGSLAALGLALAGGGSTLAADILSGVFLSRDRDFSVGDEVIAGEAPTQGVIESMDMRRIRIRDKDGRLHVIPNSVVERKEWVVLSERKERQPAK